MATAPATASNVCAYQAGCRLGDASGKYSDEPSYLKLIMPCDHVPPVRVHNKCADRMGTASLKCQPCLNQISKSPITSGAASKWAKLRRSFKENPLDTIIGTVADGIDYTTGASKQVLNNLGTDIGMANKGEFRGANFVDGMNQQSENITSQHYAGKSFRNAADKAFTMAKQAQAIAGVAGDPLKAALAANDLAKTLTTSKK